MNIINLVFIFFSEFITNLSYLLDPNPADLMANTEGCIILYLTTEGCLALNSQFIGRFLQYEICVRNYTNCFLYRVFSA